MIPAPATRMTDRRSERGALDRLITSVQRELGAPLIELSREDKQRAVRLLDEKGAFRLRKAVTQRLAQAGYLNFFRKFMR